MEILLPRMKYTHEIVGTQGGALLPERAPGACSGSKIPRVDRPLIVMHKHLTASHEENQQRAVKTSKLHLRQLQSQGTEAFCLILIPVFIFLCCG